MSIEGKNNSNQLNSALLLNNLRAVNEEIYNTGQISTILFMETFKELNTLFDGLGIAFFFIKRDILKKLHFVEQRFKKDPNNFKTLQAMIKYEVDNQMENTPNHTSASRNILRLNRAIIFIGSFLQKLGEDEKESLSNCIGKSYEETLAKYHTWKVRKAVNVALYSLPSREVFLEHLGFHEKHETDQFLQLCSKYVSVITKNLQEFYESHHLTELQ